MSGDRLFILTKIGSAKNRFVLTDIEGSEASHGVGSKDSENDQNHERREPLRPAERPVGREREREYRTQFFFRTFGLRQERLVLSFVAAKRGVRVRVRPMGMREKRRDEKRLTC